MMVQGAARGARIGSQCRKVKGKASKVDEKWMAKGTKTGGRAKGTPNKTTAENPHLFKEMFGRLGPEIEDWRKQAKKDPGSAADLALKVAEFYIPKLQRLTIDLSKIPIEEIAAELAPREAEGIM